MKHTFGLLVSFYIFFLSFFLYFIIYLYFFWPCLLGIKRKTRFIINAGGGGLVTDFCKLLTVVRISLKIVSLLILVLFREVECCAEVGGGRAYNKKIKNLVECTEVSSEDILGREE